MTSAEWQERFDTLVAKLREAFDRCNSVMPVGGSFKANEAHVVTAAWNDFNNASAAMDKFIEDWKRSHP